MLIKLIKLTSVYIYILGFFYNLINESIKDIIILKYIDMFKVFTLVSIAFPIVITIGVMWNINTHANYSIYWYIILSHILTYGTGIITIKKIRDLISPDQPLSHPDKSLAKASVFVVIAFNFLIWGGFNLFWNDLFKYN